MAANASTAAARWASGLAGAGQKITEGIQSVTVAPGQAAARQKGAYVQGVTASADKWAKNTAAVPLGDWQAAAINKGVPRIASGAQASQSKFEAFMNKLLPAIANARASLPPRGTFDQNLARSAAMARALHGMSFK